MTWEEIINMSIRKGEKTHLVFQEEVQKTILTSLSREGAFNDIVFQGGTSLRLFYGNPRFSEDLDFVLRQRKNRYDLTKKISKIQTFIGDVFPFLDRTASTIQKNDRYIQRVVLKTISDIPEQNLRIHLELAYVPSYHNQPKILHYPPLNPAVRVEDISEILADKITALGNRPYLKGRDIWDIYFITAEKQISVPPDLIAQKANDYGGTPADLKKKLTIATKRIQKEGILILSNEMKRFFPKPKLDQYHQIFDEIVKQVAREIIGLKNIDMEKRFYSGEEQ